MKNFTITLILMATAAFIQAQTVWAPPGAIWHYNWATWGGSGYIELKYAGDSLVGGKTTKMLHSSLHTYDHITGIYTSQKLDPFFTYMSNDTVYYYKLGQFYTLYNFNANPGDYWTIPAPGPFPLCADISDTGQVKVDSTGVTLINSHELKTLTISPKENSDWGFGGNELIERIGCNGFMFPDVQFCISDMPMVSLRCYYDDTFGLYETGSGSSCDFLVGVNEVPFDNIKVKVYPNPASDFMVVETEQKGKLTLYDVLGNLILDKPIVSNFTMNTSSLSKGIYLLMVTDEKGNVFSKKVILE